jgi:hypothetical protein
VDEGSLPVKETLLLVHKCGWVEASMLWAMEMATFHHLCSLGDFGIAVHRGGLFPLPLGGGCAT